MKTKFTLLVATIFLITNCGENDFDYRYTDKEDTIKCNIGTVNTPLLKEAFYSFEEDLKQYFSKNSSNPAQGYNMLIAISSSGKGPEPTNTSAHVRNVLSALKNEKDLWIINNGNYQLNYNSDTIKCLGENIQDEALRTTFNALISTNSMDSKIFSSPLRTKIRNIRNDRYLATFIALDMFYAKLSNVDFSTIPVPEDDALQNQNVPKTPPSATQKGVLLNPKDKK